MSTADDAPLSTAAPGAPSGLTRSTSRSVAATTAETPTAGLRLDEAHEGSATTPDGFGGQEVELLLQASRIAETLQTRGTELQRREQSVNEQLATLDAERRSFRLWADEQKRELDGREQRLGENLVDSERLARELEQATRTLEADRDELERARADLRASVEREYEAEREATRNEARELAEVRQRMLQEIEEFRTQHADSLVNLQTEYEVERNELRAAIQADREAARLAFEAERTAWENDRIAERAELLRERDLTETATLKAHRELEERHSELEAELEKRRGELEAEFSDQRKDVEDRELVLENRLRFQTEHLERKRTEFEGERAEHARECQQVREQIESDRMLVQLRRVQLDHYRTLLAEREKSVERERALLDRVRSTQADDSRSGEERLRKERDEWDQERRAQVAEARRQQDMLQLHSQNLESRRQRLDELRTDLEGTHRETLEMRLSVEEALAKLSQAVGAETARERVEESRAALADFYRLQQQALDEQHAELEEARSAILRQKEEFRAERQTLTEWVSSRDEEIRQHEERLRRTDEELASRESVWQDARGQWMREKIEAEEVIRDLLRQLTDFTAAGVTEAADDGETASEDDEPNAAPVA